MKIRYLFATGLLAAGVVAAPLWNDATAQDAPKLDPSVETPAAAEEAKPEAKKYWLGIQLAPTPEILKRHVERLKDGGAMIAGVADKSPAAKVGLQAGDHVLKVNDQAVTSPEQVVEVVREVKDQPVVMRVLRGVEIESYTIQPEIAPENPVLPQGDIGLHPMQPPALNGGVPGARLRFFGPGQMLPPQVQLQMMGQDLPQNLLIRVERKGDEPAKLHIEREGHSWDITENDIDQLPEDLRPIAKKYLANNKGHGPVIIGGRNVPFADMQKMIEGMQRGQMVPGNMPAPANFDAMQQQMQREIQEMHEMMRRMHEQMQRMQPPQAQPAPGNLPDGEV
ncbi:PDZ domain-containing protein [Blastopirellula marina]|uniref:PDZ domain-containing protein n=1 Tax=Blastopirellula marina TaxID=124 RepID=A0A2S8GM26_9BACT|nr:PDZ domain-containing protein [Blastopirellula marina]PQO45496.1 hypothetical protein C5Y93_13690 [Blastopirellula marina]